MARKRQSLTAQLPATPCTPDMRAKIVELSESASVSIAEVQRIALALFLSSTDTKSIGQVSNSIKEIA